MAKAGVTKMAAYHGAEKLKAAINSHQLSGGE